MPSNPGVYVYGSSSGAYKYSWYEVPQHMVTNHPGIHDARNYKAMMALFRELDLTNAPGGRTQRETFIQELDRLLTTPTMYMTVPGEILRQEFPECFYEQRPTDWWYALLGHFTNTMTWNAVTPDAGQSFNTFYVLMLNVAQKIRWRGANITKGDNGILVN